jgi:hypothetical protein
MRKMNTFGNHETTDSESSDATEKKKIDKFLLGIVVGAVLLVIVVFIISVTRPKKDYMPDNSPEGVAHNYMFALDQGDYPRAYSYLSRNIDGFPQDSEEFIKNIEEYSFSFDLERITNFQFESVYSSEDTAIIAVDVTKFYEGGIFGSDEYTSSFEMNLDLENGEWKITDSDNYFVWCWRHEDGCK